MPKLCGFTRCGRSHSGEQAEPGCRVNFFVVAASAVAGAISSMPAKGLPRQDFQRMIESMSPRLFGLLFP